MQVERFHGAIFEGVVGPTTSLVRQVVMRGMKRGDVRADAANSYVLDVIPAMMMYRSKISASEWSDQEI